MFHNQRERGLMKGNIVYYKYLAFERQARLLSNQKTQMVGSNLNV